MTNLFKVEGQTLTPIEIYPAVSDTVNYLTFAFMFSYDWAGLTKSAIFTKGDDEYEVVLTDDEVLESDHVNLSAGVWEISVVGDTVVDAVVTRQITSTSYNLTVIQSGATSGGVFPPSVASRVYINTNQSTPQTFAGGIPKLAADRVIENENDMVDAKHVADVVAAVTADDFDHNDLANKQGGAEDEYYHVTAAEKTIIENTSGTNTGDQVLPTRDSLGLDTDDTVTFANLSGTNTGDQNISGKEDISNKVTSISAESTDTQYPSAKCVFDGIVLNSIKLSAPTITVLKDSIALRGYTVPYGAVEITRPIELSAEFPEDFKIHSLGDNCYTDYDVSVLQPSGKTYHVDPVNGVDSNSGLTWGSALKTLSAATGKSDAVVVLLKDGVYRRNQIAINAALTINKSMTIKSETPFGAILNLSDELVWTKTGGYTNVYNATRSGCGYVIDSANHDVYGDPVPLTLVDSIANVDATENSFFLDGSVYYVHTFNGRAADASLGALWKTAPVLTFYPNTDNSTLYLENIVMIGGTECLLADSYYSTAKTNIKMIDKYCKYLFPQSTDVRYINRVKSLSQNCICADNYLNDGFNYSQSAGESNWGVEINCSAHDCGSGASDQGSTCHNAYQLIRLNCAYWHNTQGIADIGNGVLNTKTWSVGCLCAENDVYDIQVLVSSTMTLTKCIIPSIEKVFVNGGILANNYPRYNVVNIRNSSPLAYIYQ